MPQKPRPKQLEPPPDGVRNRIWVTHDGRRIPIRDLEDMHLANCIAKIKREAWREQYLVDLTLELTYRTLEKFEVAKKLEKESFLLDDYFEMLCEAREA